MLGIIKYMYSIEIVIVARSLRALVKNQSNLTPDPARSQISRKSPPYCRSIARGICYRLGYNFRASAASEQRVNVCRKPMFWDVGTWKYSHQPEEPKGSNELFTYIRLQVMNIFTQVVIVRRKTVDRNNQNHFGNLEIK